MGRFTSVIDWKLLPKKTRNVSIVIDSVIYLMMCSFQVICIVRSSESFDWGSRQKPGTHLFSLNKQDNTLHGWMVVVIIICALTNKVVTNCKNTVQGFKRFHGRAFSDPYVQSAKSSLVFDLAQMPTGTTGIKVSLGEASVFYFIPCVV